MLPADKSYVPSKANDYVLDIYYSGRNGTIYYSYDFLAKVLVVSNSYGSGGNMAVPFSQLDPDVIKAHHEMLMELGGHPPELQPAPPAEAWVKMGEDSVAHVGTYPEIGQKLTTIFNFASRERFIITDDLKTATKAVTRPTSFDDLPLVLIEKYLTKFKLLGGKCDEEFVRSGRTNLRKNSL